ncbi:hypothetical protein [Nocardioides sp.]|uniref:hypothetical protein n=1 Tax=Nocardioides sp. TaxID=35761 RepID=UPI002B9A0A2A|nr:hypothetical protein [Nocardioides sp.]HSX68139.1 hypothetical protein [Nocardioides sp.]
MRRFVLPVLLVLVAGVAIAALVVALGAPEASKEQTSPDLKQLEAKVTALSARVDGQARTIAAQQARLSKICDKDVVGRFDANLTGQQSAYTGTDWTYWTNLTGLLGSICGDLYEAEPASVD